MDELEMELFNPPKSPLDDAADYDYKVNNIAKPTTDGNTKKMSRGEKLFDLSIYGGIAGAAVFTATLFATYWSKYAGGKEIFNKAISKLTDRGLGKSTAETAVMTLALSMAGNIAIIPIKWAENSKQFLVSKINSLIGGNPEDKITSAREPQTWLSLIKGRILAIAAVFTGFKSAQLAIGENKFAEYENKFAEKVVCKTLGKPTHIGEKIAANETRLFRYGKIAALDIYATAAATALLYVGSRFFAKGKQNSPAVTGQEKFPETAVTQNFPEENTNHAAKILAARDKLQDHQLALR